MDENLCRGKPAEIFKMRKNLLMNVQQDMV